MMSNMLLLNVRRFKGDPMMPHARQQAIRCTYCHEQTNVADRMRSSHPRFASNISEPSTLPVYRLRPN